MQKNGEFVITKDNRIRFKRALPEAIGAALRQIGVMAKAYAKKLVPVRTGRLRDSIEYEYDAGEYTVSVGSDVSYALYVELGTSRMRARPYLRPALTNHTVEYATIFQSEVGKFMDKI